LTFGPPAAGCPASSFVALEYRIASKGKRGTGTNCVLGFTPVDCAPDLCASVAVQITFRLPGGTITAEGALFERGPCDPASAPECATARHSWSGVVVDATRGYRRLEGALVSGGGTARFRFPADPVSPFASLDDYVVVIGVP
jgi:hypothetical protein